MNQLVQAIQQAITDLRAGRVQIADDGLSRALAQHQAEEDAAAHLPPAPAPARVTAEVAADILVGMVEHLGNPPKLQALIRELRRVQ